VFFVVEFFGGSVLKISVWVFTIMWYRIIISDLTNVLISHLSQVRSLLCFIVECRDKPGDWCFASENHLRDVSFVCTAFSLPWTWPWTHDLETKPWPRYSEGVSLVQFIVKQLNSCVLLILQEYITQNVTDQICAVLHRKSCVFVTCARAASR